MNKEKIPGVFLFLIYITRWLACNFLVLVYFIVWFLINKTTADKVARLAYRIDPDPRKGLRRDITNY